MEDHGEDRLVRERDFWDHAVPTLSESIAEYEAGPDKNTALMLDAVRPEANPTILDFGSGSGVTSCWLAARGARVTGVDLSPNSVRLAAALAAHLGLDIRFLMADIERLDFGNDPYDGLVGRYALHHLDVASVLPAMNQALKPGGTAAFVETMALNPILRFARNNLIGRFGIPRYGTLDEHPLTRKDVDAVRLVFPEVEVLTGDYEFLWLLDRQVLRFRWPLASRALKAADSTLYKIPAIKDWGFHQVIVARKPLATPQA